MLHESSWIARCTVLRTGLKKIDSCHSANCIMLGCLQCSQDDSFVLAAQQGQVCLTVQCCLLQHYVSCGRSVLVQGMWWNTLRCKSLSCCDSSFLLLRATIFILKALATLAVSCPMSPYPTTPNVFPLCKTGVHDQGTCSIRVPMTKALNEGNCCSQN